MIFNGVQCRLSKWHGQRCPVCGEGLLVNGLCSVSSASYTFKQAAASCVKSDWCHKCDEALVAYNSAESAEWNEFLEAERIASETTCSD